MTEIPIAIVVIGAVLMGLWVSNILYDLKVPHYISRKIGHAAGGLGFLICMIMFSSFWWPFILAMGFGIVLLTARFLRPATFRGVGGSGRSPEVWSEVWFAWVSVPVIAFGWGVMNRPLFVLSSLLFLAWGDCVTGIVRSQVYGKAVKGFWGSVAMFMVCLAISFAFVRPLWVGVVASLVATLAEWAAGDVGILKWADDNWLVPTASLITMIGLASLGWG